MDAEEKEICDFLKSWQGQFVSGREICRRAGGKWRFRDDPKWAVPILVRMVAKGYLESDASGHFRLKPRQRKDKKKMWVSPEMKQMLKESGKTFEDVVHTEDLGEIEEE